MGVISKDVLDLHKWKTRRLRTDIKWAMGIFTGTVRNIAEGTHLGLCWRDIFRFTLKGNKRKKIRGIYSNCLSCCYISTKPIWNAPALWMIPAFFQQLQSHPTFLKLLPICTYQLTQVFIHSCRVSWLQRMWHTIIDQFGIGLIAFIYRSVWMRYQVCIRWNLKQISVHLRAREIKFICTKAINPDGA